MPGFNERTFEFCYNAEFCNRFDAILAAAPNIPSLRAERELGYDVEFILSNHPHKRSLFLQHKVAHYAEHRVGSNARFYDAHGGSYYRFPLDNQQQNVLIDQYHPLIGSWFYCAPLFHRAIDLETHFRNESIIANSIWVSPLKIGRITDGQRHNVTVDAHAAACYFHSEPRHVSGFIPPNDARELPRFNVTWANIAALEELFLGPLPLDRIILPDGFTDAPTLEKVQYVVGQVLGLSWFLLDDTAP